MVYPTINNRMEQKIFAQEAPLLAPWASMALTAAATALLLWSSWTLWQRQQHRPLPQQVWLLSQRETTAYIAVEMETPPQVVATAQLQMPERAKPPLEPLRRPKLPPVQQTTAALAGHVVRSLIKEEVDSFMQRAQLFSEVTQKLAEQNY